MSYYAALEAEHDRALRRPALPLVFDDIPSDLIERLERYEVERRRSLTAGRAPRGFRPPSAAFEHKRECR